MIPTPEIFFGLYGRQQLKTETTVRYLVAAVRSGKHVALCSASHEAAQYILDLVRAELDRQKDEHGDNPSIYGSVTPWIP